MFHSGLSVTKPMIRYTFEPVLSEEDRVILTPQLFASAKRERHSLFGIKYVRRLRKITHHLQLFKMTVFSSMPTFDLELVMRDYFMEL